MSRKICGNGKLYCKQLPICKDCNKKNKAFVAFQISPADFSLFQANAFQEKQYPFFPNEENQRLVSRKIDTDMHVY